MTDRFQRAMRLIHAEGELRGARMQMQNLRKFIAGALCAECGEPLGTDDGNIVSDDDDRTIHKSCETSDDESE